jgi:excisionase family DNA binding protein
LEYHVSKPVSLSSSPQRRWANQNEAAEYLGVSTRTVRSMIADGRLRGYRNGPRMIRLDLNEIDASMRPFGGAAS